MNVTKRFRVDWVAMLALTVWVAVLVSLAVLALDMLAVDDEVVLQACVTEDDPGPCYWFAGAQGNGRGSSLVVVDGVTYRLGR